MLQNSFGKAWRMETDFGLNFWLTQWNLAPSIVIGTALVIGLYLYGVGPLRRKYHLADTVKRSQVITFLTGVLMPTKIQVLRRRAFERQGGKCAKVGAKGKLGCGCA